MKVLQLLALGLASASTAAASRCRLSSVPPVSSASSAPSSVSSAPASSSASSSVSSSASASSSAPPSPPQPICVRNVVNNGYFDSGSLDGWTLTEFGGGAVVGGAGTCGQFGTCALLDTVTGGYVGLSQTVPNTGIGLIYTFSFSYRAVATLFSDALLVCQINGGANGLSWSWTQDKIPVGSYGFFMTSFAAQATSLTVNCAVSGSYENKVQLDYINLNC